MHGRAHRDRCRCRRTARRCSSRRSFPTTARSRRASRTTSPRAATPKTSTAARRSATIRTAGASRSCRCRRATCTSSALERRRRHARRRAQVLGWNDDGSKALLFSTSTDFKNRWIHTRHRRSTARSSWSTRCTTARGSPARASAAAAGIDGGKRFYFVSEADGYAHLYTMAADGERQEAAHEGQVGSERGVALARRKELLSHDERGVAVRAALLSHAGRPAARAKSSRRKSAATPATLSPDESMIADVYSYVESSAGAVHSAESRRRRRRRSSRRRRRRSGWRSTGSCRRS